MLSEESKNYNIEKINIITIAPLESWMGVFNYNANLLVSSYIIAVGSMLIDTSNINTWYQNLRYFNSETNIFTSNDLEAPLLENTNPCLFIMNHMNGGFILISIY